MRKILRGFRCAVAAAALLGVMSARAAEEDVTYWDPIAGQEKKVCCHIYNVIQDEELKEDVCNGWYALKQDFSTRSLRSPVIKGTVNLILCDGAELNADLKNPPGLEYYQEAGIVLKAGNKLTIWGQKNGTGKLVAVGGAQCAGIGLSRNDQTTSSGTLVVNGGVVEARGNGRAAGIGGANAFGEYNVAWDGWGNGGTVEINGGQVTATSGYSDIGDFGAGIGGAAYGAGGSVIIRGGTVVAKSQGESGYGIGWGGGRDKRASSSLQILGGSVNAKTPEAFAKGQNGAGLQCVTVVCSGMSGPL